MQSASGNLTYTHAAAGLDVDKMDYLCRDQLFTFAGEPGRFHSMAHIQELLDHARVVVVEGPVFTPQGRTPEPQLRTEIAFERTRDGTLIERVNDLFDTRSLMHEKVYQCGCGTPPARCTLPPVASPATLRCVSDRSGCSENKHRVLLGRHPVRRPDVEVAPSCCLLSSAIEDLLPVILQLRRHSTRLRHGGMPVAALRPARRGASHDLRGSPIPGRMYPTSADALASSPHSAPTTSASVLRIGTACSKPRVRGAAPSGPRTHCA